VAAGEPMLSPTVTRQLIAHIAAVDPAPSGPSAGGLSNAQTGAELHLSVATVKAHVSRLLVKLDLANRGADRPADPRRFLPRGHVGQHGRSQRSRQGRPCSHPCSRRVTQGSSR
jgi:hypothetical protein